METAVLTQITFYERKFKSYYVVWKPHNYILPFEKMKSLNRTMQYGNCMRIEETDGLEQV